MSQFISACKEIGEFLMHRKKWWLFPLVGFLVIIGGVIVASAGSPLAPFIYTLF